MKIGPKYKIARRLGAPIFEKTQTQKYALSEERKMKNKRPRQKTDYGLQLTEKQKARMYYGITEKQFKNYVKKSVLQKSTSPSAELLYMLETRLDNLVWRIGFAPTHRAARVVVTHGHITVNGKKVRVPSYHVTEGDIISIREGSKKSGAFVNIMEKGPEKEIAGWINYDNTAKSASLRSRPADLENQLYFDLGKVIEFYQR